MIAHAHGHDNEMSVGTEHWRSMDIGEHVPPLLVHAMGTHASPMTLDEIVIIKFSLQPP